MSSGTAAIAGAAALFAPLDEATEESLSQFEALPALAEGALLVGWLASLGPTAKPLQQGLMGYVVREGAGAAGIVAPLLLSAATRRSSRRVRRFVTIASSALTLLGVFALRFAVVEGGRISADDPAATFEMTG
jgi:formate-dependent nitrite reductase membrane component NrfD